MSEWPVRWTKPMFKTGTTSVKVTRGKARNERKATEEAKMREARKRDGHRCRFPLCGCKRYKLRLDVSHQVHRGMGGNPAGDRSDPSLLMTLCCARHKDHAVSIDKGTLKWEALTDKGANGPVRWFVRLQAVAPKSRLTDRWVEVATETGINRHAPFTDAQLTFLNILKEMEL